MIWVADWGGTRSPRSISARDGRLQRSVSGKGRAVALAAGGGALWVANSLDSTMTRVDLAEWLGRRDHARRKRPQLRL